MSAGILEKLLNSNIDIDNEYQYNLDLQSEHSLNSFIAFLCGVPSNIAKPIVDSVMKSPLGKRFPGIKQGYDYTQKMIELKYENNSAKPIDEKLLNLSEVSHILEDGDDDQEFLISIVKACQKYNAGDKTGALEEFGSNFIPNFIKDGTNIAAGIETAKGNFKENQESRNDINNMYEKRLIELSQRKQENNAKIYKMTNGKQGSIDGLMNSPKVFNRIDGILTQIEVNIQKLEKNLQHN